MHLLSLALLITVFIRSHLTRFIIFQVLFTVLSGGLVYYYFLHLHLKSFQYPSGCFTLVVTHC